MSEQYVKVSGGRIFYTVAGVGDPVMMIHGNFNDHSIWDEQASVLSSHYQCIRYDLRGYGQSSTPTASFSNVKDLKALVDILGLSNVTLIGSSSGGSVAVDFSLAYPELVKALILVAPSIHGNSYPPSLMWQGIKNFIHVRLRGREQAIAQFLANPFWQYCFPAYAKKEARQRVVQNMSNSRNFCRFSPKLSLAAKPYAFGRLHELPIATLIIVPGQDHPYNIRTANAAHAKIANSTIITMPGCGHFPFVEEPEEFNHHVLDFLSSLV
ncbi:alpha/beta hydrolase [Paenibacillus sp. 1011MAR3C5]|uniref:alpha/beta fold hydrolase n=1 Tax=Paenibacillus sp. 1011MAR3C5 TaxID=1675787 RepID=UPI000E6B8901|nr:alpha/beta hydrolase [Paenibacillus sp. 1011MAR3C5]RJE83874.1 alpha/beta hydrolase [Paenibacillus sp. 1011MAR3C5]